MHIDIDPIEIGRNYQTHIGAISDSRLALEQLILAARELKPRAKRDTLRKEIATSNAAFLANFNEHYTSSSFPMRLSAS